MKASFWGLFKTNFYGHFRKLFLFTKFNFLNFGKKFFLTILKFTCLEFCASNYNFFSSSIIDFKFFRVLSAGHTLLGIDLTLFFCKTVFQIVS